MAVCIKPHIRRDRTKRFHIRSNKFIEKDRPIIRIRIRTFIIITARIDR